MSRWLALGAVNGAAAVAVAAAAAHGPLASIVVADAARFHILHALALGLAGLALRGRALSVTAGLFQLGALGFSVGIYLQNWLGWPMGPVVPLGGTLLILGWLSLAVCAWRR
ncbi:DUF423 domain-containing protein [Lacibacterium aquatile]|uniref:DUF423 domain-containing protein n=1 Tax=Lacibacterium aquatile TaxID=1168082 RepID=A0ABW5DWB9_9PROT